MTTTQRHDAAELPHVTDSREDHAKAVAYRRARLGLSQRDLGERVGLSKNTVAAAEAGVAHLSTYRKLEAFFDDMDQAPVTEVERDWMEFDATGPRTEWHVTVRGPADRADEMREQLMNLVRDIEQARRAEDSDSI